VAGVLACLFVQLNSHSSTISDLSSSYTWLKLLHYKNGKSEIDDPAFFLSEKGKTDPEQELQATIKAFETSVEKEDKHPVCKFPARYYFLKKNIKIKLKVTPECKKLNEFLKEINPHSISLVFSDAYINSPASMYGHTFIRIDPPVKSRLLGYAVNYAAHADQSEGFKYYLKGIFGLYKGFFSIFPYYKKIFEYNNLESRDLWEYSLNISKENVYLITLHVWELKNIYSYYYFFDKNCSYQILHLLDLGKLHLNAVDHFNYWVIPVDTIRFLKKTGLIRSVYYRPSASSRIKAFINANTDITEREIRTARKIAKFEVSPEEILQKNLSERKKAQILELSKLIFIYYSIRERMPYEEYKKKFLRILKTRSKIRYIFSYNKSLERTPPDDGHKSQMLSVSSGTEDGKKFVSLLYRGAYHGLEDYDEGYIFGSEVLFPYFELRNIIDKNKTVINELSFIRIRSYAPRDIIFKPVSWIVSANLKREWLKNKKIMFFNLTFGMGVTYGKENNYLISWILRNEGQLNTEALKNSRIKTGGEIMFMKKINRYNKVIISFYPFYAFSEKSFAGYNLSVRNNLALNHNTALQIKALQENLYHKNRYEFSFSINRFF